MLVLISICFWAVLLYSGTKLTALFKTNPTLHWGSQAQQEAVRGTSWRSPSAGGDGAVPRHRAVPRGAQHTARPERPAGLPQPALHTALLVLMPELWPLCSVAQGTSWALLHRQNVPRWASHPIPSHPSSSSRSHNASLCLTTNTWAQLFATRLLNTDKNKP